MLFTVAILVLGWVTYQKITATEDGPEHFSERLNDQAAILTDFSPPKGTDRPNQLPIQTPRQQMNNSIDGVTQATPNGGSRVVRDDTKSHLQSELKQSIAWVRPSVVNIKATKGSNGNSSYENVGSGIIVSTGGYVLTNYHVIANADRIVVSTYSSGRQSYLAWVIDHHVETDLTLLKIETHEIFEPVTLGNSDYVELGDMVIAIGNPFGLEQTVTSGIVSGVRKNLAIDGINYANMIQTDAPLNRGSSGGPLTNLHGEVIGINTAIYAPTGVFSGTGFAIPINRVKRFLAENNIIQTDSYVQSHPSNKVSSGRGWMGIEVQPVDRTTALHLGLPYIGGALVNDVLPKSPAWKHGLERGDVILQFNGNSIPNVARLETLLAGMGPSQTAKVIISRDKQLQEYYITLSELPLMSSQ